jgi:hypothetical protein
MNPRLPLGRNDIIDPGQMLSNGGVPLAQETSDDVALIWLQNPLQLPQALAILQADQQHLNQARIQKIYAGAEFFRQFRPGRRPHARHHHSADSGHDLQREQEED